MFLIMSLGLMTVSISYRNFESKAMAMFMVESYKENIWYFYYHLNFYMIFIYTEGTSHYVGIIYVFNKGIPLSMLESFNSSMLSELGLNASNIKALYSFTDLCSELYKIQAIDLTMLYSITSSFFLKKFDSNMTTSYSDYLYVKSGKPSKSLIGNKLFVTTLVFIILTSNSETIKLKALLMLNKLLCNNLNQKYYYIKIIKQAELMLNKNPTIVFSKEYQQFVISSN